jgi:hypothetical protein
MVYFTRTPPAMAWEGVTAHEPAICWMNPLTLSSENEKVSCAGCSRTRSDTGMLPEKTRNDQRQFCGAERESVKQPTRSVQGQRKRKRQHYRSFRPTHVYKSIAELMYQLNRKGDSRSHVPLNKPCPMPIKGLN